ncbi:hypothetical protein DM558_15275 [Entomomonas moraniae]|uniref:C-type lysozyme inhibitor domain-containing protein n=1 Tax=Entomomonas moraniae TaxID=2213226 RepID=A0A451EQD5_9GAMM|nr:MliC family protein [Entomomonas moraniae]AZS52049.1 hypothetical protein DM558_15275 [Entomomonas moraniae]
MKLTQSVAFILGTLVSVSAYASETIVYQCDDGQRIEAAYPDTNTAILNYQSQLYLLKVAISASGARYTGEGLQWWTKGGEGNIAPLLKDEKYASAKGKNCYALQPTAKELISSSSK